MILLLFDAGDLFLDGLLLWLIQATLVNSREKLVFKSIIDDFFAGLAFDFTLGALKLLAFTRPLLGRFFFFLGRIIILCVTISFNLISSACLIFTFCFLVVLIGLNDVVIDLLGIGVIDLLGPMRSDRNLHSLAMPFS